jgi:hypothetical protein
VTTPRHHAVVTNEEELAAPSLDSAVLVIRLWREGGHPRPLRARIHYQDALTGEQCSAATASPERALAIVREWFASLSWTP